MIAMLKDAPQHSSGACADIEPFERISTGQLIHKAPPNSRIQAALIERVFGLQKFGERVQGLFPVGRPIAIVFPQFDGQFLLAEIEPRPQAIVNDAREMFERRIKPIELGQLVQCDVLEAADHGGQCVFQIDDVDQIAVLVQAVVFDLYFDAVMMAVPLVFGAPIAADQIVLRDEIPTNGELVHKILNRRGNPKFGSLTMKHMKFMKDFKKFPKYSR